MSYRLLDSERRIYVRAGNEEALRGIEKIIFDFDGVLVQTSQSYRQTITEVVDYYFIELLGLTAKKGKLATLRDIQKFKDTGLYNNDWKLSYALITYYLTLILKELKQKGALEEFMDQFCNLQFTDILTFIKSLKGVRDFLERYKVNMIDFADLKDNGAINLDVFLTQTTEENQRLVKRLAPYDLEKPDLIKRLFEEIYLGKDLFTKNYGTLSVFNFNNSLIDVEEFIPTKETMDMLRKQFGTFGIYSGRPKPQGIYVLEKYGYTGYFDEQKSVFLGDLLKSAAEMERLGKPDPTLFIELIEKTVGKETSVVYVGDGIADAMMIEKAKAKGLENLTFLGAVSSSEDSNKLFTEYSKHGVDAVITDINYIPYILKNLGSG
ncbi:MAG TPA: HAD family hydrolase [Acidobacteriota bacterium]|nr:HAD family hydrolase [Acidobacteriota bacterium]